MADLGKAYVQIMPSAKGFNKELDKEVTSAGDSAGKRGGLALGKSLLASIGIAAIGTAIVKGIKAAVEEGAKLQQSYGGIETLYKDSADQMKKYASEAFKTVGLSANEYMENVTSFSAGLIASLGGDTQKAAEVSDMAMRDMADNANKFGTDMQSIQNAYQGFAKQNYTMLDNLKLGYGGTKTEMERLLADAEKLTGVKYDISNLSDVYTAINVIQTELGVTGTTSQEAAQTVSGSFAMMQSSFTDFLGNLAMGENIDKSLQNLIESIGIFLKNLMPMVGTVAVSFVQALGTGIVTYAPILKQKILEGLQKALEAITQWDPSASGNKFATKFAEGMKKYAPVIAKALGQILLALGKVIINLIPKLIEWGQSIVGKMLEGINKKSGEFGKKAVELIGKFVSGILGGIGSLVSAGLDMVKGIWQGISNGYTWITNKISGWVKNVIDFIKSKFGIHSPSKVMAEEVGKWIPSGISVGIESNTDSLKRTMSNLSDQTVSFGRSSFSAHTLGNDRTSIYSEVKQGMYDAMQNMSIKYNNREVGRMVRANV